MREKGPPQTGGSFFFIGRKAIAKIQVCFRLNTKLKNDIIYLISSFVVIPMEKSMKAKITDLKKLEEYYAKAGNHLLILYGQKGCGMQQLISEFMRGKKTFYYRCRQASAGLQNRMLGEELSRRFDVKLQKFTYDEYFNRIKTGDPSKLVLVIDEAQYVMKKDPEFAKSIIKLRMKRLYPGPVLILLTSSSLVWAKKEAAEAFGEDAKHIDGFHKVESLNFLEVVRAFPTLSVRESIKLYGVLGGVPAYMDRWNGEAGFKENICRHVLSENGFLYREAENLISAELRELSVYNTILASIAAGRNKLNDLFHETGFSRAKISVYMKNLAQFDIVEKLVSFETGGWENAKKGVYQIKNTFVNFWFKFVYPHMSELVQMEPEMFYDAYVAPELDSYLNRYFRDVCMEYLSILNQMGKLPFAVHKMGTWVGKEGSIDIIAQSADRQNIIGFCNWREPMMTMAMCEEMAKAMEQAKISSGHYYLFSATDFEPALKAYVQRDPSFQLIDMKEL